MAKAKAKSSTTKIGNAKVVGATAADKQAIRAAKAEVRAEAKKPAKVRQTNRGDKTPEAKASKAEKQDAAKKLFTDADTAARLGIHPDTTVEQHENRARLAALGY